MTGGFTFCGIDIKDVGLEYVPELENTYVYAQKSGSIHEETRDGHNGGYYYGSWIEPKEFKLRCVFQETNINRGILNDILHIFRIGRAGRLVFETRPWCYYDAVVTEDPQIDLTNYMNGLVTFTLKSYFPFCKSDALYCSRTNKHYLNIMQNTAMVDRNYMVPPCGYTSITERFVIPLLNPGTEKCPTGIRITGDVKQGVVLKNLSTNQTCTFVYLTPEDGTVECDGLTGKIGLKKNDTLKDGYLYHRGGFISLESSYPIKREVFVRATSGSTYVESVKQLHGDYKGYYIYLGGENGGWEKILSSDKDGLTLENAAQISTVQKTSIAWLNEIEVSPLIEGDEIDVEVEFDYKPIFA